MARLLLPLVLFGSLVFWIYSTSLRDRHAIELRGRGWVIWPLLAIEFIVFGVLIARIPVIRTPIGVLIVIPLLFGIHGFLARAIVGFLKRRDWLKERPNRPALEARPAKGGIRGLFERNIYLAIALAYLITAATIMVIYRIAARS